MKGIPGYLLKSFLLYLVCLYTNTFIYQVFEHNQTFSTMIWCIPKPLLFLIPAKRPFRDACLESRMNTMHKKYRFEAHYVFCIHEQAAVLLPVLDYAPTAEGPSRKYVSTFFAIFDTPSLFYTYPPSIFPPFLTLFPLKNLTYFKDDPRRLTS